MNLMKLFRASKPVASEQNLTIPQHIAIIMDGNGRWAQQRGLPRSAGHRAGMENIRETIDRCLENGVRYLTLYAFSTENWKRPQEEVDFLMDLFLQALKNELRLMHQKGVQVCFIGIRDNLNTTLVQMMQEGEALTSGNERLHLNIAMNYGGRAELAQAFRSIAAELQNQTITEQQVDEALIGNYLFTAGQPDPDLLIRPGGEFRISNFLVWQSAYTELYFTDVFWPDFNNEQFMKAIAFYSSRERRFGGIKGGKPGR